MKILIIEDEEGLRESIEEYFTEAGNICETATNYQNAIVKINLYRYDCVLLDITLPGGNGIELLKSLKENNYPDGVLIISAKNSLDDRLDGVNLGADDYLVKPFHLSELKARVSAIIRRKTFNGSNLLIFNEITIDLLAKEVMVDKTLVKLTRKEYELLLYFIANKGSDGYLIPEMRKADYFLMIKNYIDDEDLEKLLTALNRIPEIVAAVKIDPKKIKSRENLLF